MGLKDVLDAIDATLPASWHKATGDSNLPEQRSPPSILWVPEPEPWITPLKMQMGQPGALWTRQANVSAHLWASAGSTTADLRSDIAAAEGMLATLVEAIHDLFTVGGYQIAGPGEWYTGGHVTFGVGYKLPLTFLIPVVRATPAGGYKTLAGVHAQTQITDGVGGAPENGPVIVEP